MKISKKMTRQEFAAAVVHQLEKYDISCILVGGACVSIYTEEKYTSHDLDFISPYSLDAINKSLSEIGFQRDGRYFKHPHSSFFVEFPSGPLSIGEQTSVKPEGQLKVGDVIITLLSPTQCVMDRLAAWFHWDDRRSFIQALWVCEKHPVSLSKIRQWAKSEGHPSKLEQFVSEYKKIISKT